MVQLVISIKKLDEIAEIVSSTNPLEFNVKNAIKNFLNFQLTKVNGTNITLIDKRYIVFP